MKYRIFSFFIGVIFVLFLVWIGGYNFDERSLFAAVLVIWCICGGIICVCVCNLLNSAMHFIEKEGDE